MNTQSVNDNSEVRLYLVVLPYHHEETEYAVPFLVKAAKSVSVFSFVSSFLDEEHCTLDLLAEAGVIDQFDILPTRSPTPLTDSDYAFGTPLVMEVGDVAELPVVLAETEGEDMWAAAANMFSA